MLTRVWYHDTVCSNTDFMQTDGVVSNPKKLEHLWDLLAPAFKATSTSIAAEQLRSLTKAFLYNSGMYIIFQF